MVNSQTNFRGTGGQTGTAKGGEVAGWVGMAKWGGALVKETGKGPIKGEGRVK
jgi:hypothetical protein